MDCCNDTFLFIGVAFVFFLVFCFCLVCAAMGWWYGAEAFCMFFVHVFVLSFCFHDFMCNPRCALLLDMLEGMIT